MVLVVGSAEQYGRHELNEMPLHEDVERRPLTLYAGSKVPRQEVAALQAAPQRRAAHGIHAQLQPFGRGSRRAFPASEHGVARTGAPGVGRTAGDWQRRHRQGPSCHGYHKHLYSDCSSVVRNGEVPNVCSGEEVQVRALASAVLQRVGIQAWPNNHLTVPWTCPCRGRRPKLVARHRLESQPDSPTTSSRPDSCRDALICTSPRHWLPPIVIGQAAEFDYSGTQARVRRRCVRRSRQVILINSNPSDRDGSRDRRPHVPWSR